MAALRHQAHELSRRNGFREEEALAEIAAHLPKHIELSWLLDPLCDRPGADAAGNEVEDFLSA